MSNVQYLAGKHYCVVSIPIDKAKRYGIDIESNVLIQETDSAIIIKKKGAESIHHSQPASGGLTHSLPLEDELYGSHS